MKKLRITAAMAITALLLAEPSDTWMSDFTTTDDEVRFRVEANETEELREGTVSLTYVYGEDKTVNAVVNVSQAVMQSSEEPVPVITITTEDPLALAADGGSYTIEYEITDPAEDGSISASRRGWKHIRGRRRRRLDYRHQLRYRWSHNLQRSRK